MTYTNSPELQRTTSAAVRSNNSNGSQNLENGKNKSGNCISANENTSPKDFRELKIWKLAKQLAADIYQATQKYPREELYGLCQQMRAAAVSIASNIAEGYNRRYSKEYQRFLYIALGSCGELETQVELSVDLGYIPKDSSVFILEGLDHESRMIRSLIKKLDAPEQKKP